MAADATAIHSIVRLGLKTKIMQICTPCIQGCALRFAVLETLRSGPRLEKKQT